MVFVRENLEIPIINSPYIGKKVDEIIIELVHVKNVLKKLEHSAPGPNPRVLRECFQKI